MALHPPKQKTVAVTTAAAAAAGALAASQTTAIIARIGLLEYICANDVDPSVAPPSALDTALAGARCSTIDGTKCWQKYAAATTAWKAIHEVREIYTVPAGADVNAMNVTVAVPEDQGVVVTAWTGVAPVADWEYMKFNGNYVVGAGGAMYGSTGNGNWGGFALFTHLSKVVTMIMSISPAFGGIRTMRSTVATANTNTGSVGQVGSFTQGAITSIGIGTGGTPMLVAGSWIKARVLNKGEWS
jgi:hypothetical protein